MPKQADFDSTELTRRLQEGHAVVRLNVQINYADIYSQVSAKESPVFKATYEQSV
jgi:hypothetical protein